MTSRILITCASNMYLSGSLCYSCHSSCLTCSNGLSTGCTSCGTNKTLTPTSLGACQCNNGYYMDINFVCQLCHTSCGTCTGSNVDSCTSCTATSPTFRTQGILASSGSTFTCKCLDTYYENSSLVCIKCNYRCKSCNGTSSANCTECITTERVLASSCACPSNYIEISQTCTACHYSCATCTSTSATSCSTCATNRTKNSMNQLCECNGNLIQDTANNNVCTACHSSCITCSNLSNTGCTTCAANRTKNTSNNLCECNPKYFEDTSVTPSVCTACHYTCASCTGSSATSCSVCAANRTKNPLNQLCECNTKYFEDTSVTPFVCTACHYSCASCTNSSITGCTSCDINRLKNSTNSRCECINKYFEDASNSNICSQCHSSCETCVSNNSNTSCVTCVTNRTKSTVTQICDCNSNFFENTLKVCESCHPSCASCTDSTDISCSTCVTNRSIVSPSLKCECNTGLYPSSSSLCGTCHYSCGTCSDGSSTGCITCAANRTKNPLNSLCECNTNYFEDALNSNACSACHSSCETCITNNSNTSCVTCRVNRTKSSVNQQCECNSSYFENFSSGSGVCESCHPSCASCTDSTDISCSTCVTNRSIVSPSLKCDCNQGYFPISTSLCQACHYSCKSCLASTSQSCDSCKLNRILQTDNSCLCPNRFFEDSTSSNDCVACHYSCETCSSAQDTSCTSCVAPRTKVGTKCECPTKTFSDAASSYSCTSCHSSCETCSGTSKSQCITCGINRHFDSSQICVCDDSFVEESGTCVPCHYSCTKCTNSTSSGCSQCQTHRSINGSNECPCDNYFFEDSSASNTCTACHASCQNCTGTLATECTVCSANRTYDTSSLLCLCNSDFIEDLATLVCLPCHYSCKECSGTTSNDCTQCDASIQRVKQNTAPASTSCLCNSHFYEDPLTKTCTACHSSCSECNGPSSSECTSCDSIISFREPSSTSSSQFSCQCLVGYFEPNNPYSPICQPCHQNCLTCNESTSSDCLTCNPNAFRELQVPSSTPTSCVCQLGYFDDSVNVTCSKCHYSCKHCDGPDKSDCIECFLDRNYIEQISTAPKRECVCPSIRFESIAKVSCDLCHDLCETCNGPLSTNCLTCHPSQYRQLSNNTCVCKSSMYEDSEELICKSCDPSCLSCTGPSKFQCASCDSTNHHRYLSLPFYVCACSDGYFENFISTVPQLVCQQCLSPCATCDNTPNECLTCLFEHQNLLNNQCECAAGYYFDNTNQQCILCNNACSTCTGPTSSDCLECSKGYMQTSIVGLSPIECTTDPLYSIQLACDVSCAIGKCHLYDNSQCSECASDRQKMNGGSTYSKCICVDGFFERTSNRACEPCNFSCYTCTGESESECLTCGDTILNHRQAIQNTNDNKFTCPCSDGYYEVPFQTNCEKCSITCLTCFSSSTHCTSCKEHAILVNGHCECEEGYFYSTIVFQCLKCHHTCQECIGTGQNQCITCSSITRRLIEEVLPTLIGSTLIKTGTCECSLGYFDDYIYKDCQECDRSCLSCETTASNCLSCSSLLHRQLKGSTCICLDKFIEDSLHNDCRQCPSDCSTCTASGNCVTCDSTRELNTENSRCECKSNTFETSARKCQVCDPTCQTCSDSSDFCTSCYDNANITINFTCECLPGYFMGSDGKCIRCNPICFECENNNTCSKCDSSAKLTMNETTQQCECYFGYSLLNSTYADSFYCIEQSYLSTVSTETIKSARIRSFYYNSLEALIITYQCVAFISLLLGRISIADTAFVMLLEVQFFLYSNLAKPMELRRTLVVFHDYSLLINLSKINVFSFMIDHADTSTTTGHEKSMNSYFNEFGLSDDFLFVGGGVLTCGLIGFVLFLFVRCFMSRMRRKSVGFYKYPTKFLLKLQKMYFSYFLNLFLSFERIIAAFLFFVSMIAISASDSQSCTLGYLCLVCFGISHVRQIFNFENYFHPEYHVFENLSVKVQRLQLLFLENLLYIFTYYLVYHLDGLWFASWQVIFRVIVLIPLTVSRQNKSNVTRYLFLSAQILISLLYVNLIVITLYVRKSKLTSDDDYLVDVSVLLFQSGISLFLITSLLGISIDVITTTIKFYMSKTKFELTLTQIYQQSISLNYQTANLQKKATLNTSPYTRIFS